MGEIRVAESMDTAESRTHRTLGRRYFCAET